MLASLDTELDAAARNAVSQMRFDPLKVNGKPIDWDLVIIVDFRLKK